MAQNQSLHLHIDDGTRMVPISMLPVPIWRCEDRIFLATLACSNHAEIVHAPSIKSIYILYPH